MTGLEKQLYDQAWQTLLDAEHRDDITMKQAFSIYVTAKVLKRQGKIKDALHVQAFIDYCLDFMNPDVNAVMPTFK